MWLKYAGPGMQATLVVDIIDLSALDANAGIGGNQAFSFIGTAAFSGAGQLRYTHRWAEKPSSKETPTAIRAP